MGNLPAPIADEVVEECPSFHEMVHCITRFGRPKHDVAGGEGPVGGFVLRDYPLELRCTVPAQAFDTQSTHLTVDRQFARSARDARHPCTTLCIAGEIPRPRGSGME